MISRAALVLVLVLAATSGVFAEEQPVTPASQTPAFNPEQEYIGEFSGWKVPVSYANYYFVRSAIAVFGTRWGASPNTEQELDDRVWEQLALSYEAYRRGITVEQQAIEDEISKMLTAEKVSFDWKKDKEAYAAWVKEKTKASTTLFENQLRHLLQLENLRKQVLESFKPGVTEEEAHQEFLNEHNTLELELAQFDELPKAEEFYKTMKAPGQWDEKKAQDEKFLKHPGFVSLEFLIHMWKYPKDDLYKMLAMDVNATYQPIPIYKGWGVTRILQKRPAKEEDFPKYRESYFKQVEMNKKYEELKVWLAELKKQADIKLFPRKDKQDQLKY